MKRALRQIQKDWDTLGREDPLWAILTDDSKRGGQWNSEEFFATGRTEIALALESLTALGVTVRRGRALDFGCGVGRLTQALAEHFARVDGVDVAPSMIARARQWDSSDGRCQFILNESEDLRPLQNNHYDFIYSAITLQHIERPLIRGYLRAMIRKLAPGGVLLFQLPSEPATRPKGWKKVKVLLPSALLRIIDVWRHGAQARMQMHGLGREEVETLLREGGCRVAGVTPDGSAGATWIGYRYCAVKEPC